VTQLNLNSVCFCYGEINSPFLQKEKMFTMGRTKGILKRVTKWYGKNLEKLFAHPNNAKISYLGSRNADMLTKLRKQNRNNSSLACTYWSKSITFSRVELSRDGVEDMVNHDSASATIFFLKQNHHLLPSPLSW